MNSGLKSKFTAAVLSLIASFSLIGAVDAHAAAADESPILYLEVSKYADGAGHLCMDGIRPL